MPDIAGSNSRMAAVTTAAATVCVETGPRTAVRTGVRNAWAAPPPGARRTELDVAEAADEIVRATICDGKGCTRETRCVDVRKWMGPRLAEWRTDNGDRWRASSEDCVARNAGAAVRAAARSTCTSLRVLRKLLP